MPAPVFDLAALRGHVSRFAGRRLVVWGDLMLDRYLWGRVDRISPEAPVPVVEIERESFSLGGAGNVAANLKALGAEAVLVGALGQDADGDLLLESLAARGIETGRIVGEDCLVAVGRGLLERIQANAVLVTRGADGMSLFEADGRVTHLPTAAREVYDVTGAGDTVVGVVALSLAVGASFPDACFLAN